MLYESLLVGAILLLTTLAVLMATGWRDPLDPVQRALLLSTGLLTLGVYFFWQWTAGGRTLAMKTWALRVCQRDGSPLRRGQAIGRYLLAWHLFVPGVLVILLAPAGTWAAAVALFASPWLMLATTLADPERQCLHDRWLGTHVLREPRAKRP